MSPKGLRRLGWGRAEPGLSTGRETPGPSALEFVKTMWVEETVWGLLQDFEGLGKKLYL